MTADFIVEALTHDERETLRMAYHARQQWEYGECDHGTYSGGPDHGQPYAMCERWVQPNTALTKAVERILTVRLAAATARAEAAEAREAALRAELESLASQWEDRYPTHCLLLRTLLATGGAE